MQNRNLGNIKLVSLLFILGSCSAVMLIPAVIQKENNHEIGNVKGNNDYLATSHVEPAPIEKTVEIIKKEYIDVPVEKVITTTKEIKTYIDNPAKIIYKESAAAQTTPTSNLISQVLTNPVSFILGENSKTTETKTSPEAMMKITKEMVENCRIITSEYNKVSK